MGIGRCRATGGGYGANGGGVQSPPYGGSGVGGGGGRPCCCSRTSSSLVATNGGLSGIGGRSTGYGGFGGAVGGSGASLGYGDGGGGSVNWNGRGRTGSVGGYGGPTGGGSYGGRRSGGGSYRGGAGGFGFGGMGGGDGSAAFGRGGSVGFRGGGFDGYGGIRRQSATSIGRLVDSDVRNSHGRINPVVLNGALEEMSMRSGQFPSGITVGVRELLLNGERNTTSQTSESPQFSGKSDQEDIAMLESSGPEDAEAAKVQNATNKNVIRAASGCTFVFRRAQNVTCFHVCV